MSYQSEFLKNNIPPQNETIIEINSDLRNIKIPQSIKNVAVSGDHVSETLYFKVPRYFDNKDLSEHDCIIRVINAKKEYSESKAINIDIQDDYITFAWLITNYATRYAGKIQFSVQFETIDDGVKYQWQTTPAELNILGGINIESTITDKDDTYFRKLTNEVQALQDEVISLKSQCLKIDSIISTLNKLIERVNYLEDHVVYTIEEI